MIELSWTVDPGAGGLSRLDGLPYDQFASNAAGYGNMRRGICAAFDRLGVSYRIVAAPSFISRLDPTPLTMPRGYENRPHPGGTRWRQYTRVTEVRSHPLPDPVTRPDVIRICIGTPDAWDWGGAGYRIGMTMWESSEIPTGTNSWIPWLDSADEIIVPCEHNAALIRPHTAVPVRVVGLGLNADEWPLLDRSERSPKKPFTFLLAGQLSVRKGWMPAVDAFWRAFHADPRYRLILKSSSRSELCYLHDNNRMSWRHWSEDPTIHVMRTFFTRAGLLELYRRADAFLWPTRGEGWGLPPREAAMTGLPVITPIHTGQDDAASWAWRPVKSSADGFAAIFTAWGYCGQWYQVDVDDLAAAMVEVVERHDEAVAWTRDVARPYLLQRSWSDVAEEILSSVAAAKEVRVA